MNETALRNSIAGRFGRQAKSADDYVQKLTNLPKLSSSQKRAQLANILGSDNAMERLGQGMIGPILIKLRYQGIVRNMLLEDPLVKGAELVYDVLDDLGLAYFLNDNESEVKITPFEGKRVRYNIFRVATFPEVKKEDLYLLRVNVIEYAQDMSKQDIMKKEDSRFITLADAAIVAYGEAADHVVTPGEHKIINNGDLDIASFYAAVSLVEMHELESNRLVMNPIDARDMYLWDVNTTGWTFKDNIVAGQKITTYGEFLIQKSIVQTEGDILLAPEPKFLGMMPVLYSLDVEENNQVEQFKKGWVMDEVIGMVILNPRGLAHIVKE